MFFPEFLFTVWLIITSFFILFSLCLSVVNYERTIKIFAIAMVWPILTAIYIFRFLLKSVVEAIALVYHYLYS